MSTDVATKDKVVSKGYKYFMVFLCMLTQAIPYGIAQNIQPLFIHPLVNTFHFTLASYTLIFTFGAVFASVASPFIGKALEKVNFRLMYLIGIGLSAIAYVIFGISTKLPGFYIAAIICMIGSTFYSGKGVPWVINHWFPAKGRGAALGIAFCGGSIGNIFLQPATQAILKHFMTGNTKTGHLTSMAPFFIFAVALLVIGIIIACFIRTPKKDEIVISDAELAESKKEAELAKAKEFKGWTSKQVLQMKWFWIFSLGFLIIGLGLASLNEDYAAFLDTKLSLTDVGLIGSMYGVGCLIGNVSGGFLFDKFGTAKSMTYAGCMSGPAFMAKDLFGSRDQGVMLGYVGLAYAIGYAIGAPLFGIIKGKGSFTVAWYFMIAFVAIGFIILVFAVIQIKRSQKKYIIQQETKTTTE